MDDRLATPLQHIGRVAPGADIGTQLKGRRWSGEDTPLPGLAVH